MHVAIQFVYCHYMLTPCVECLWYVKFWHLCLKQKSHLTDWMTRGQAMACGADDERSLVQQICVETVTTFVVGKLDSYT